MGQAPHHRLSNNSAISETDVANSSSTNGRGTLPAEEDFRDEITEENVRRWKEGSLKQVGKGGQATVYEARLSNGKKVAVKKFESKELCQAESDALSRLDHKNVITHYKSFLDLNCVVLEYMNGGSLQDRMDDPEGEDYPLLTWMGRVRATRDLVEGLIHIHEHCFYHRDIKPNNLLFDEDDTLKISDMGLALKRSTESFHNTTSEVFGGAYWWVAPEYKDNKLSDKVDIYALGLVIVHMCCQLSDEESLLLRSDASHKMNTFCEKLVPIDGCCTEAIATRLLEIGLECCEYNREKRPKLERVREVTKGLERELVLQEIMELDEEEDVSECVETLEGYANHAGDKESKFMLGKLYIHGARHVPADTKKAQTWLQKAASEGKLEATQLLSVLEHLKQEASVGGSVSPVAIGELYLKGLSNVAASDEEAMYWLMLAFNDRKIMEARKIMLRVIFNHVDALERKDVINEVSLSILEKAATDGILEAQLLMAQQCSNDENKKERWLKAAAKTILQCLDFSHNPLLMDYSHNQRLDKQTLHKALVIGLESKMGTDKEKALKLLEATTTLGGDKEKILKELMQRGEEARLDKKWKEAKNYLSLAQKGGAEGADRELKELFDDMYRSLKISRSKLSDTERSALSVLSEAAMDGKHAHAQMRLGFCYQRVYGVCVDEKRAAELYSMAAYQAHYPGQYYLGEMYLHGKGVPKNTARAEEWMYKAEEGGSREARELLSKMRASYTDPVEFNWSITNWKEVSEKKDDIFSDPFSAHGVQWKLKLGLRGDRNNYNHITVYLHLHNRQSLPSDWWAGYTKMKLVHFTLTVVNQKDKSQSRGFEGYHVFSDSDYGEKDGDYWHTPRSLLNSESDGFVLHDGLEVKVSVRVEK